MSSASKMPMPGTHHRVEVNGIRLHYTLAGSGEPVVLLHGFPMTSYFWRKVIPALAERFTVIAPDLRGCGDSDRPTSGYDKRTIAEDIHQLVHLARALAPLGHRLRPALNAPHPSAPAVPGGIVAGSVPTGQGAGASPDVTPWV